MVDRELGGLHIAVVVGTAAAAAVAAEEQVAAEMLIDLVVAVNAMATDCLLALHSLVARNEVDLGGPTCPSVVLRNMLISEGVVYPIVELRSR